VRPNLHPSLPRRAAESVGFALVGIVLAGTAAAVSGSTSGTAPSPRTASSPPPIVSEYPPPVAIGMWISRAELGRLPMKGVAWNELRQAARGYLGRPDLSGLNSNHDVRTLAAALMFARTGQETYRSKVVGELRRVMDSEIYSSTLSLARNLVSYVIAADLVNLPAYDASIDASFRAWISSLRTERLGGRTLVSTQEERPNNWGTHAAASRIAVDLYLGDSQDLTRAAAVFRSYLGEQAPYVQFRFGRDLSWQADPDNPRGINPRGAARGSISLDGAQPEEMRRGGSLSSPPRHTGYPWEALQGSIVAATLLGRAGFDAWNWGDQAIRRAVGFLERLDRHWGGWWATGDDTWQLFLINRAYGTRFATDRHATFGKNVGWTAWTHSAKSQTRVARRR
jgi:hypothetical protein